MESLSLEGLLDTKIYVKPESKLYFGSPGDYIAPFVESAKKAGVENFTVKTGQATINAETTGEKNIAYSRVCVEAQFGELVEGFRGVVGLIYALDTKQPILKGYTGYNVSTCINLSIFNAESVYQKELVVDSNLVYKRLNHFIENKKQDAEEFSNTIIKLREALLTETELNEMLGKILRSTSDTNTPLGTTPVINAAKLLDDSSSAYYVRPDGQFSCSKFNVYNSITQGITESRDVVFKPNKTIHLAKLILN